MEMKVNVSLLFVNTTIELWTNLTFIYEQNPLNLDKPYLSVNTFLALWINLCVWT